ncbi:MAG: glycerol-3-phosphate 1-O-acyltransferase PlsY [Oscillospiraceae bacterium]|jgi:glycerol-3-phosphate acyltransferase PlsY|nr:glycerol-3-phosphate 1-O-acyltransferase PlsY [Oscillospiraceae bacterium]
MLYACVAFAIIAPYLICSVNPAIIVAKLKSGSDIRKQGSGNPGLTNTFRTQGKTAALAVLTFDALKGVISVMLARLAFYYALGIDVFYRGGSLSYVSWLAALMAVTGHIFPVYYGFKGGKAVLVTVSALFVVDWISALILLSLFILIVVLTRYVSLGSVIAAAALPVCVYVKRGLVESRADSLTAAIFTAVIALLLIVKHKKNIRRLIDKKEKKLGEKA